MKSVRWLFAAAIFILLAAQTIPMVARDLIVYGLIEQGAEQVKLSSVKIHWVNTSVELIGLDVQHADSSVLTVDKLSFDIYLREILDKRLRLSGFRLEGVNAELRQEQQLLLLGPIVLLGGPATPVTESEPSSFEFGSDLIELVDVDLKLIQANSDQRLNIERLTVGGLFQWAPFEATDVRFVGHLNDAPIVIDSSALPLPERKTLSIQLALRDLNMSPLVGHLLPGFEAVVEMNLNIEIALEANQAWLTQTGSIGINGLNLGVNDLKLGLQGAGWQGETEQQLDLSKGAELLEQIRLEGTLDLLGLDLRQQDLAIAAQELKLTPSLTYRAADQALQGSVALGAGQLTLENKNQVLTLAQLSASLAQQPLGLDLVISGTDGQLTEGHASDLGIQSLDLRSQLSVEQGRPLWQPNNISGELRLVDAHVRQASNQLALDAAKIDFASSSLSELDDIEIEGVLYGISADASALQTQAERLSLSTRLQQPQGSLSIALGLSKFNAEAEQFSFNSSQFDLGFDGQLDLRALQSPESVAGELDISLSSLEVNQGENNIGLEGLKLAGPFSANLSTDAPYGLQVIETLQLETILESLAIDGQDFAGGFDRLSLVTGYTKAKGYLDLGLDLKGLDLAMNQTHVMSSQFDVGFDGQLGFSQQQSLDSVRGELDISSSNLAIKQNDNSFSFERLDVRGPFSTKVPTDALYDLQSLETLQLETLLETLVVEGQDLAGGFDRLSLMTGYSKGSGEVDLSLALMGLDLAVNQTQVKNTELSVGIDGVVSQSLSELNADLQIDLNELRLRQTDSELSLKELSFNGPTSIPLSSKITELPVALKGDLNLSTLALSSQTLDANFRSLVSTVDLSQTLNSTFIKADLNLNDLDVGISGQKLRIGQIHFVPNLNQSGRLNAFNLSQLAGAVDLQLSKLNLDSQEMSLGLQNLELNTSLAPKAKGQSLVSKLKISDIGFNDEKQDAGISLVSASIATELDADYLASQLYLTDARINELRYTPKQEGESANVASFKLGSLSAVNLDGSASFDSYEANALTVEQLRLGSAESPTASLDSLLLDRISFSNNFLQVGNLLTNNLKANIQTRLKTSATTADRTTTDPVKPEPVAPTQANIQASDKRLPIDISFDSWLAQGRTELSYRDSSLAAPLNLNFVATEVSAGAWDSRTAAPLNIKLTGKLNESTGVDINARITPLKTKPDGDWTINVNALPLPTLSPLAQSFAGYQLRSGMLNLNATGSLTAGQIKGSNKLSVQRLEVQRGETVEAGATDQLFTMPLPSVVSLLENDERMIKLDLPVSGDISDPKFNYQDVIQLVVTTAVKEGAMTYLTRSLQPYGAILMAYGAIKEAQSGRFIQLQPLEYDPASAELNQIGRDYAAKLAGMMEDRPGLTLEICPITLASEEQTLRQILVQEQLAAEPSTTNSVATETGESASDLTLKDELSQRIATLANQRIDALSSALVRVGVSKERIFPCIARSGATDGAPRVELAF